MTNMATVNGRIHYYRKVRLKSYWLAFTLVLVSIVEVQSNRPPRFIIDGGQSEIVLRLKESPETPVGSLIYHLKGYDPDNDPLTFGIIPSQFSDIIRIENFGSNEAKVYLAKDLDREVSFLVIMFLFVIKECRTHCFRLIFMKHSGFGIILVLEVSYLYYLYFL